MTFVVEDQNSQILNVKKKSSLTDLIASTEDSIRLKNIMQIVFQISNEDTNGAANAIEWHNIGVCFHHACRFIFLQKLFPLPPNSNDGNIKQNKVQVWDLIQVLVL